MRTIRREIFTLCFSISFFSCFFSSLPVLYGEGNARKAKKGLLLFLSFHSLFPFSLFFLSSLSQSSFSSSLLFLVLSSLLLFSSSSSSFGLFFFFSSSVLPLLFRFFSSPSHFWRRKIAYLSSGFQFRLERFHLPHAVRQVSSLVYHIRNMRHSCMTEERKKERSQKERRRKRKQRKRAAAYASMRGLCAT